MPQTPVCKTTSLKSNHNNKKKKEKWQPINLNDTNTEFPNYPRKSESDNLNTWNKNQKRKYYYIIVLYQFLRKLCKNN